MKRCQVFNAALDAAYGQVAARGLNTPRLLDVVIQKPRAFWQQLLDHVVGAVDCG